MAELSRTLTLEQRAKFLLFSRQFDCGASPRLQLELEELRADSD